MSRRTRYQQGSVQREKRQSGSDVWVFRWWEPPLTERANAGRQSSGTVLTLANRSIALKAAKALRIDANQQTPQHGRRAEARLPNWSLITAQGIGR
jgi:hypothetical protein